MATGTDVRAGRAFVEVGTDATPLERGLRQAQARLKAFGDGLRAVGTGMAAVGASITGALLGATKMFASTGDTLDKMAGRTGVSVEALSEMGFAADLSGASLETLETGIRKMQRSVTDAAEGTQTAVDALAALGLSAAALQNLAPEQQFKLIADRLSKIENPTTRAALAMEVFGKSGTQLLPMISNGAAGLAAFAEQARALGLVMSAEDARAAAALNDALDSLWKSVKAGAVAVGSVLAGELQRYAEIVTGVVVAAQNWIRENRELVVVVAKIAVVVTGVGVALTALGVTAGIVSTAMRGLAAAVALYRGAAVAATAATGALNVVLVVVSAHPVIAALTAVGVAVAAIGTWALVSKSGVKELGDALDYTNEAAVKAHAAGLLDEWKQRNVPGAAPPVEETEEPRDAENWARRIHQLRIALIEDEHARHVASIEAEYDAEVEKARAAGALQSTLDDIALARKLELAKVAQDIARQQSDAAARGAAEAAQAKAAEELRLQQEAAGIAQANADRAATVAELELRAKYRGLQLEQALLELQKQRAILAAKTAGENVDLVEREFALREALFAMEEAGRAAETEREARLSTQGTFSPMAVSRAMQGYDLKIVETPAMKNVASEGGKSEALLADIAKYAKKLAEGAAQGRLVFA